MDPAAAPVAPRRVGGLGRVVRSTTRAGGRVALAGTLAAAGLLGGATLGPAAGSGAVERHERAVAQAPTGAQRVDRASAARLEGQARVYAAAERSHALALALAAVEAADGAAAVLTSLEAAPSHAPAQDAAANAPSVAAQGIAADALPAVSVPQTDALVAARADLERAATLAQVVVRTVPRTAPQPDGVPPETSPIEDLAVAEELSEGAAEVFALAMKLEVAVQEAAAPQVAAAAPVALESAAETAVAQAQVLAPTAPAAAVPGDWVNGAMPLSALCAPAFAPGALLHCDAAAALERLNAAYRADTGADLSVVSGYRSHEHQAEIKRRHGGLAAAPGRSNHGRGIAVDLADMGGLGEFDAPAYLWMKEHAAAFGWYHPKVMEPGGGGPPEPWHWEFGTDSGYDDRDSAGRRPPARSGPTPVTTGTAGAAAERDQGVGGEGRPGGSARDLKPVPRLTSTPVETPTFPQRPSP